MYERAGDLADHTKFYPMDASALESVINEREVYGDSGSGTYPNDIYSSRIPNRSSFSSPEHVSEWAREEVKNKKMMESMEDGPHREPPLYEDIAKHGVQSPVTLVRDPSGRNELFNGHHRVYSAADMNPDMLVPVNWAG